MPISLLVLTKFANILQSGAALQSQLQKAGITAGVSIPAITPALVLLSSASPEFGDNNLELSYPRVCLSVSSVKNLLTERFRSFSGAVTVMADIWASADLVTQCDLWIHYYLDAVTSVLVANRGDWGDGVYFSGLYEAQISSPKTGGFGFVQSAKLACTFNVSLD